jgi:hypothetical protein
MTTPQTDAAVTKAAKLAGMHTKNPAPSAEGLTMDELESMLKDAETRQRQLLMNEAGLREQARAMLARADETREEALIIEGEKRVIAKLIAAQQPNKKE